MKPVLILLAVWIGWNLITFLIMGIDKRKAIKDKQRISEMTLLLCSFVLGGLGIGAGALVFHHKTKKWKFRILIPISLIINGLTIYGIICLAGLVS